MSTKVSDYPSSACLHEKPGSNENSSMDKKWLIQPQNIEIGKEVIETESGTNTHEISRFIVYISLKSSLKILLETPNMFEIIKKYIESLNPESYVKSNIIQCQLWKTKYLNQNKFTLPLFLGVDDFKIDDFQDNCLDSTLMGVYISLPFLPPHLFNNINNIFLVTLCYSKYRKLFGNMAVFRNLINELNSLSQEGLEIIVEDKSVKVYFQLVLLTGGNLILNEICGFIDNFEGDHYCRMCTAKSLDCKTQVEEDIDLLRNQVNYQQHLEDLSTKLGVKENCCFNNVLNFNIMENKTNDLYEDLCEVIIPNTLENVLSALIFERLFDLDTLNRRISNFKYAGCVDDKIQPFVMENLKRLKTNTVQGKIKYNQTPNAGLFLSRYLGLIIGDLVPECNKYWKLYKVLRKIIKIITSPRFLSSDTYFLSKHIEKYNRKYIQLFRNLRPNMHFWLHYRDNMIKNGPLINYCSKRNKEKSNELKNLVITTRVQKDLPMTIAMRHQLSMENHSKKRIYCLSNIKLGTLDYEICNIDPKINNIKIYKNVEIDNRNYCPGMVIIKGVHEDDGVIFKKIYKIYEIENKIYFLLTDFKKTSCFNTFLFDSHYFAYEVRENENSLELVDICDLHLLTPCIFVKKRFHDFIATPHEI